MKWTNKDDALAHQEELNAPPKKPTRTRMPAAYPEAMPTPVHEPNLSQFQFPFQRARQQKQATVVQADWSEEGLNEIYALVAKQYNALRAILILQAIVLILVLLK